MPDLTPPDTLRGEGSTASASGLLTPASALDREPTWKQHDFYAPRGMGHTLTLNLDSYFQGPRDIRRFSRWPYCIRLYGSVLPKMVVPLFGVGLWATTITCICQLVHDLSINSILLTVLGFVVGLALSFRFSTSYERYNEGSKYWSMLILNSRNLARLIWIHVEERHSLSDEQGKADLLGKLSAINLLSAFAVALKHRLRYEPATSYVDLANMVVNLDTMAGNADQDALQRKPISSLQRTYDYLGIPLGKGDPREVIDNSDDHLGNLPLEILTYLSSYMKHVISQGIMEGTHQGSAMGCIASLTEVLSGTERICNTPIPMAYSIAIAQITWVYVLLLPFQLQGYLGWLNIPGTLFAAYIVLSFETIGREIENPFGSDVNDLPLEEYCCDLAADFDVLTRSPPPNVNEWVSTSENRVMYPLSMTGYTAWVDRSLGEIREALKTKASNRSKTTRIAMSNAARDAIETTPLLETV